MDTILAECFAASLLANNLETQKLRDTVKATGAPDARTTILMGMVLAERSMQLALGYREAERQIKERNEAERLAAMPPPVANPDPCETLANVCDHPAEAAVA